MTPHPDPGPSTLDFYAVLEVPPTATGEQIRRAYRRRALALHPDRNPDPRATAQFRAAAEAFAVLSDPLRRAAYDATPPAPGPGEPSPGRGPDRPSPSTNGAARTSAADYAPVGEPVAHTDYAPTSGYAPPPPPTAGRAQAPARSELLPAGWPVGRIDHRRVMGRLMLGVWRLAPLPAGRIAIGAVVAATLAAAALAATSREELPLESTVIGVLASLALACWTVRALTFGVLHIRHRVAERTR